MADSTDQTGFRGRQPMAVDHAFAILEEVARQGPGTTARQIVEAIEMPRATVYRILKHLVQQEYLVRSPDLRGFALGQRVHALAATWPTVVADVCDEADVCNEKVELA